MNFGRLKFCHQHFLLDLKSIHEGNAEEENNGYVVFELRGSVASLEARNFIQQ
jgi:hypothetical protein